MLFINFVCLFYLMVLVASHTISKSIDRSDLFDDAVDSVDDHQPQKHRRRDKDNKLDLLWWRKSSVLKQKPNKLKSTTLTAKEVNNAKVTTIKQRRMEELVSKEKATKIEKIKSPQPIDDDWERQSDKTSVIRSDKYVRTSIKQYTASRKGAEKEKKQKKKHKSKHGGSTRARGRSDDPREKQRRDLLAADPASGYVPATTAAGYQTTDHTLSHYYKMLAEMSTKLDKLMRQYSNSYGPVNRAFTIPSLQALRLNSNRYTDSFRNRVFAPDNFEGTNMLGSFRALDKIAKQTQALANLITNAFVTPTADPMLAHYDPHHRYVMQMALERTTPTLDPSTKGINKKAVMNTVKTLKKGHYKDDEANYFVVKPGGRIDRAVNDLPKEAGSTVGEQIGKKLKCLYDKFKQSVIVTVKGHEIDNATKRDDQTNSSLITVASPCVTSTKSKFVTVKVKVNQIPYKTTLLRPAKKVFLYTKLPRGKHRKENVHSTKRHSSKHKKKIRKKLTHNTSTTPMTVVTEDEDYAVLSLVEQMLSREVRPNMPQLLSTAINPTIKRHYRRAVDDPETGSTTNISLHNTSSNYEDPNTDPSIDETSYEGLTKKISYKDFVDGYKHYLNFEKDMGHSNFSNMVRYQAHRHHDVEQIGKFILDKLPQLPMTQERYKRDFFDDDDDEQDISTKSEESWFKKHFFYFADRNVPSKKFHSSQLVPLKLPLAARDSTTRKPNTKLKSKKNKPKSHRGELQSADGEKMDDLEELAWMLKRSSSTTVPLDIANTPQNIDDDLPTVHSSRDVTSARSARLFTKMFRGIKGTAKKSPRRHTIKRHGKRRSEDARLKRIRRHEVNKKLKSKYNYVQRDEAEPTKPSNLFDQVAADEQKTKEKRDRIETANATIDGAIEDKGKKKLGYVNVEIIPATTVGTFKKEERGRFGRIMQSFRFHVKKPDKRQKRAVTKKQRGGLLKKFKQLFRSETKTNEPFPKDYGIVTRKLSAYNNPAKLAKNLYKIPSIADDIRNTDYPDLTSEGRIITSAHLKYWVTVEPLKAVEPTVSRVQQMYEESRDDENHNDYAEKLDEIRKELENTEAKTSSPFDKPYDPIGRKIKEFEDILQKVYFPNEMTKGNILNTGVILTDQSKHHAPKNNNVNDDYTLAKKNNAVYEHHAAPLDNAVTGIINYTYKKPYTKDLDDSSVKLQYKDKITNISAVTDSGKAKYFFDPKSTTINDDFNDLIIWNSDILHSDSVLKPTTPPVKVISMKDEFSEFLKDNHVYPDNTLIKNVKIADKNQKDRHPVSKGGKKTRAIKYKGRNAKNRGDSRRNLPHDNIKKRLNAPLSRSSSTDPYDRMSKEIYNKVMSYDAPNPKYILTDTTTLPYEKYNNYLRDGMKITQNALLPEVRSFAQNKKNKSKMTLPQQFHTTPLPMKHKDFDDFLKLYDIDVESVTAHESGTWAIISPSQITKTELLYNSGNSKSNKNHVDRSHDVSKELFRSLYGFEDGVQKSLKWKIKDQKKSSIKEGDSPGNLLKAIQSYWKEVDDYNNQSELPQLIQHNGKNNETTEPDLKPDSKPDDSPDPYQENMRYLEEMKEINPTLQKPGEINKFNHGHGFKHNKLLLGKDEVSTQPVSEPTKFWGGPAGRSPPKRIIIKGHSYKYDIVYGAKDLGGMLSDRGRKACTKALADTEDPAQDHREQGYDQPNITKVKDPDQERRKDQNIMALHFGSGTSDNGMVSVKDSYNFVNSLPRQHTLGASELEPHARPAGTLDFHNYFDVGVKHTQEFKDKLERKRKENRKGKREAGEEPCTAKNVAEIEVVVDLIKNPEAYEELSRSTHTLNTISPVPNKEAKSLNSIQVHIGVPRYGTECHSAKRSLQNIKKVFIAKLCTPVDLEYQVKSYVTPPSTAIPTGVYLLMENNDSLDGNLVLKPIFHNMNVAVVKPREITTGVKDYSTEKITTTQTLSKLNKVTLTRDFVVAFNKHLMQLCELLSVNDTHHVHARAANEEKPRRSLNWKKLKKYFRGEHVCDCNCKANATMCNSCAASDRVMTELIYEIDTLIKYMNDHCTEIQTFFYKNPSGGKKLKDSVKLLDKNLQSYYKRVKGKCHGKSCDGFRLLDKRFFFSTPKYKYTDLLNYFPYGVNTEDIMLTENSKNDVFLDKDINIIDKPDKSETTNTKNKTRFKTVYSLDNVNVNIICKDNNVTTAKVKPERFYIGGHVSNAPLTESILVRVENKLKNDFRHSNKYKKREVGQIDSPLNADSSGSFWNNYFNKINESALLFVATDTKPDTGTSKVNNERNETTVENINLSVEKASYLTTIHGSNHYNNLYKTDGTGDRLQTRSATLSNESIISTEAPSTDKPLQEDLNELIKLLEDVYVKDFNDITTDIHIITKKPVDTIKTTETKNQSKCKCVEKETADTDTPTYSTLTDNIVSYSNTTDSSSNTLPDDTTDDILTDDTQIFSYVANISETATEDWRSSTRESKNLFPYLKKIKGATLGWFNYDKSKEGLDIDNLTPVTHENDQLFRVMQVLGIKNKKEAYTTNHAKSQGTTVENPTILIINDNDEHLKKYSHAPDIDNSSGMDVLDIQSTADSNNLLLSLLKYESEKLAKEWKRYAGHHHNTKTSVDEVPNKEEPKDNVKKDTVEVMKNTQRDNATREKGMEKQKGREKKNEQNKQCEKQCKKIKNEKQKKINKVIQNEIEKEEKEEKEIEKEIQDENHIIVCKENEIAKEKRKKERYTEKLRKLKEKRKKLTQEIKHTECKIIPTVKVNKETKLCNKTCKEAKKVDPEKKEGNLTLKPCTTVEKKPTTKKVFSLLEPLRKLELPPPPPGKEGFINRFLNKFNVSWCTPVKKREETESPEEAIPVRFNDYYDSDAIMSVSLITGDKEKTATERRAIVNRMDPQKSDDGSVQPRRLCDLQDTFSYALRCLQQDKERFQDYAKRIPCHRYMNTPKCFCIEPGKHERGNIAVFKEPKRKFRWDWKRNKRSLYVEEVEDDALNDDDRAAEELLYGNTHSVRDALMSNDDFERMYKDEFGIYRIETRKKRSSVDTEAVIQGLKDLAPIKVPKNEIYAMPRDSVTIPCTLDGSEGPISWSWNEGPIPDNAVAEGTHLVIQHVKTENSGNYSCFQCFRSDALSEGKRESWTQLTVVKLPVFRIVTFLLYRCRPLCSANEVGALRELGHHMTKAACPGSSCTVQVHRPTSLEDQTTHSSLASVFVDVAPARRAARCGVECARNMYCSLARLIAENAATIATIPVIVSRKVRNTTMTPLVRQKILVTQTNIQESNPLRTHAKWTSGELDVKMSCPSGFYLVSEMKLCVTNPVRHLPAIPRRLRRYDWWRPSYVCVCACVVVAAACAGGANALARGDGAAEGGRGDRVTTLPCVEATGRRPISPSRVILPRLFRHASSRISQDTKLDLKKIRLPPPPPPPIDFDP